MASIASSKPKIVISTLDAARIEALLENMTNQAFPGREELEAELSRAELLAPEQIPPNVVTMNSTVTFRMLESDRSFSLTLVYPRDADASGTRLSVLAPVGSALLGLAIGDEIEWPKPGGGVLRVRIEEILYQPEREGDFSR
jgi:regulator of nucleoside diphosphate kinase